MEEIFVNISHYAYEKEGAGNAVVTVEIQNEPLRAIITIEDRGKPYDPFSHEEPDISLPGEQRKIGGLGIYMTKKTMDDMSYVWQNGRNILTITKNYSEDDEKTD